MREVVWEQSSKRRGERWSQAVVERCQPSVWSLRSSLEEASQAGEGHTHTDIRNNSQRWYVYWTSNSVHTLKSTRVVFRQADIKVFWFRTGRTNPCEMFLLQIGANQLRTIFLNRSLSLLWDLLFIQPPFLALFSSVFHSHWMILCFAL